MQDPNEIPESFRHLIEKRESADRRESGRRCGQDRRKIDLGPLGAAQSADDVTELLEDRRSGNDRRSGADRRSADRRENR